MADASISLALAAALALGLTACSGIDAGIDYPSELPDIDSQLLTPENAASPAVAFSKFKIAPDACKGIDTHPITQPLTQEDFTRFLEAQGLKIEPKKARDNLYWYEFPNGKSGPDNFVRLRLAVLDTQAGAVADLHASLLEHGPGWWGVRRSNLAVLAPKAGLREGLSFAMKHKLACWGMFTIAGNDDAYVVQGPYSEL